MSAPFAFHPYAPGPFTESPQSWRIIVVDPLWAPFLSTVPLPMLFLASLKPMTHHVGVACRCPSSPHTWLFHQVTTIPGDHCGSLLSASILLKGVYPPENPLYLDIESSDGAKGLLCCAACGHHSSQCCPTINLSYLTYHRSRGSLRFCLPLLHSSNGRHPRGHW